MSTLKLALAINKKIHHHSWMTVNMYEWHHVWHCEYIAMKEMDIIFVPWWFARLSTTSLTHPPERKKQLVLKCIDLKTLFFLKKKNHLLRLFNISYKQFLTNSIQILELCCGLYYWRWSYY